MSKLRTFNFRKMDKLLRYIGFGVVRQKGSHVFYRHSDGRTTTVPNMADAIKRVHCCVRFCGK